MNVNVNVNVNDNDNGQNLDDFGSDIYVKERPNNVK